MRADTTNKTLFIIFAILLIVPFVITPTTNMLTCLDITVFNPTLPPVDVSDYILWKIAREEICNWLTGFIPAFVIAVVMYGIYDWFFTVKSQLKLTDKERKHKQ